MKVAEIDPFRLPKVRLSEVDLLPEKPGVYFAFVKGQMVYIGMTGKGFKSRWAVHHETPAYGNLVKRAKAWERGETYEGNYKG